MRGSLTFTLFVPLAIAVVVIAWYLTASKSGNVVLSGKDAEKVVAIQRRLSLWRNVLYTDRSFEKRQFLIGTNINLDLIVPLSEFVRGFRETVDAEAVSHEIISTKEDFFNTLAFYLERSAAAERFVTDGDLFNNLTNIASLAASHKLHIGGNAALIAEFLATFDHCNVHLYGPVGPKLRPLLSNKLLIHETDESGTDEIHLIIEYKAGERFSKYTSSIANRFIVHHDVANSRLTHASGFLETAHEPGRSLDWVVWSGLHFLDSLTHEEYMGHISAFKNSLESRRRGSPIHLELASMANADFVRELYQNVVVLADSLGLNDQELMFLSKCIGGPELRANGPVDKMIEAMTWILTNVNQQKLASERRLSRVHMHSHRFHAIAVSKSSQWYGSAEGVLHGAFIAAVRACGSESPELFDLSKAKFSNGTNVPHFDEGNPVITWTDSGNNDVQVFLVPTILCRQPVGTVGLGDAISAAALLYNSLKLA